MTRVAAVDCGTNSIRLLVADADPATGELKSLDRRMEIVRLGQGVDRTGGSRRRRWSAPSPPAATYARMIEELGAERLRFVATSASRDAQNRDEFVSGVVDILGVEPEVITGDQEAQFSFTGATKELSGPAGPGEAVSGRGHRRRLHRVRGRRRIACAPRAPWTSAVYGSRSAISSPTRSPRTQIEAMRADVAAALDEVERTVPLAEARTLVGLAGTVTTVSGIALGLDAYDSAAIHHSRVTARAGRRDRAAAAVLDPRRTRGDPRHAPGPRGRDRRGLADTAGDHGTYGCRGGRRQRARHPRRHCLEPHLSRRGTPLKGVRSTSRRPSRSSLVK